MLIVWPMTSLSPLHTQLDMRQTDTATSCWTYWSICQLKSHLWKNTCLRTKDNVARCVNKQLKNVHSLFLLPPGGPKKVGYNQSANRKKNYQTEINICSLKRRGDAVLSHYMQNLIKSKYTIKFGSKIHWSLPCCRYIAQIYNRQQHHDFFDPYKKQDVLKTTQRGRRSAARQRTRLML